MRYDLTDREAALIRQKVLAEQLAAIAKQSVLDGIVAGIPDAPDGATFALRESPDGRLYVELEPPASDVAAAIAEKIAAHANSTVPA